MVHSSAIGPPSGSKLGNIVDKTSLRKWIEDSLVLRNWKSGIILIRFTRYLFDKFTLKGGDETREGEEE